MEVWKKVPWADRSVSNLGRFRNDATGVITTGARQKTGYCSVHIKGKNHYLHRLIGECFLGKPEDHKFINHKNGVKYDNRAENLEWVTRGENTTHAIKSGLSNQHSETHSRAISKSFVEEIYSLKEQGKTLREVRVALKQVDRSTVRNIFTGYSWKFEYAKRFKCPVTQTI